MGLKLPGWLAVGFSVGLWLLAAFAPDVFPDWIKLRFVYLGALILFATGLAALWHLRPIDWLTENVLWRLDARRSDPISNLSGMLYVGETTVSANNLANEGWLEIAFRFFNASRSHLRVRAVEGSVRCCIVVGTSLPDDHQHQLPTPSLLRDRSNIDDIPPLTEVMIVLQQYVGGQLIGDLQAAIAGDGLHFYFDDLNVSVETMEERPRVVRLPLSAGVNLITVNGIISRRIVRLSVDSAVSTSGTFGS